MLAITSWHIASDMPTIASRHIAGNISYHVIVDVGCGLTKYVVRYIKRHYDSVRLRKDVAKRLREFAKNTGLSISDAVAYLLDHIAGNMPAGVGEHITGNIAEQVADYVVKNYGGTRVKLIEYPGGDYFIFSDLNRIFMSAKADVFVEVFGGSCWCSLNVSRSKFRVIVCNDIDEDLITLYKLVKENPSEVIRRAAILPFSRELNSIAVEVLRDKSADPITRAVMLFYVIRTSFSGEFGKHIKTSKARNEAKTYANAVAAVVDYAVKFRDVVLECKDFREVLKLYDSDRTLFYLDPPYVGREYYRFRFTVSDLREMVNVLRSIKGFWVLKIARDNYELIKSILPNHEVEEVRTPTYIAKAEGEERPEFTYLVAHNIKKRSLGLSGFSAKAVGEVQT